MAIYGRNEKKPQPKNSPKDEASAHEVMEKYEQASKMLYGDQWNYWLNHAYLIGEQWLYINPQTRTLDQLPQDPERVQTTINHIWPASRTIMAKLLSRELQFYVPPTGADDATIRAAKTSESILRSVHREHDWEGLREEASWAVWKGGTAAICVNWDSNAGTPLGILDDNREYGTGDTKEEALAITDFVVEPGVRNAETARWWIKAVALPPEQIQDDFQLDWVPEPDASAALSPFQRKLITATLGGAAGTDASLRLARVYTLYERPNTKNKEGRIVSVVNDKVVDNKPWPFPWKDRLNLVILRETRIEGFWNGDTVLKAARPVQRAINQSWSSIIEHMKLAGNARLFVPQSAVDMLEQMSDLPGEVIPYPDGTSPPEYASPPQMPTWWIEEPVRLKNEMDDILGNHDVSRGEAPGRVDSALAISILIEQDSSPIGRLTKETGFAFGRLAEMVLRLYEANVKETRKATVKTPGQPARTIPWSGKHLKGQVLAEVPTDAIMPRSRAAQQAFADKALQGGLIRSLHEWYKLADIPMDTDLLEYVSPDIAKARRENAAMARGEISLPAPFDNHNEHIQEHLTFMKSAEWDLLKPEEQQVFILHNQGHATLSAEEMGAQMLKAQMSPGLGAAASATGAPVLPVGDQGANPTAAAQGQISDIIQQQNPNIPAPVIQEGVQQGV